MPDTGRYKNLLGGSWESRAHVPPTVIARSTMRIYLSWNMHRLTLQNNVWGFRPVVS